MLSDSVAPSNMFAKASTCLYKGLNKLCNYIQLEVRPCATTVSIWCLGAAVLRLPKLKPSAAPSCATLKLEICQTETNNRKYHVSQCFIGKVFHSQRPYSNVLQFAFKNKLNILPDFRLLFFGHSRITHIQLILRLRFYLKLHFVILGRKC